MLEGEWGVEEDGGSGKDVEGGDRRFSVCGASLYHNASKLPCLNE